MNKQKQKQKLKHKKKNVRTSKPNRNKVKSRRAILATILAIAIITLCILIIKTIGPFIKQYL